MVSRTSQQRTLRTALPHVRTAFQPIVDLESLSPVAYEALARGPVGTGLESPSALFEAAARTGQVEELDWACRASSFRSATEARLDRSMALFVNVEPSAIGEVPDEHRDLVTAASRRFRVVVEITERSITRRPAELLAIVERARAAGFGIALDDVGADVRSLALLPFLRPDVVKLDMSVIQDPPSASISRTVAAVLAATEETGARILAEGIETEAHLARARALGAQLGQGWLFGRPQSSPMVLRTEQPLDLDPQAPPVVGATPYETVAAVRPTRVSTKAMLVGLSKHLERQALAQDAPGVILAAFQTAERFTPDSARRYEELAARCSLVAALGIGLPAEPARGVRGATIAPNDALADEWSVVVVGPHYAAALVARDLGDAGDDADRRFDHVVTHNRALVVRAARSLLRRIIPV